MFLDALSASPCINLVRSLGKSEESVNIQHIPNLQGSLCTHSTSLSITNPYGHQLALEIQPTPKSSSASISSKTTVGHRQIACSSNAWAATSSSRPLSPSMLDNCQSCGGSTREWLDPAMGQKRAGICPPSILIWNGYTTNQMHNFELLGGRWPNSSWLITHQVSMLPFMRPRMKNSPMDWYKSSSSVSCRSVHGPPMKSRRLRHRVPSLCRTQDVENPSV